MSLTGLTRKGVFACCRFASLRSLGFPSLQLFIPMEDRRLTMLWITKLCSSISFSLPKSVFPHSASFPADTPLGAEPAKASVSKEFPEVLKSVSGVAPTIKPRLG